MILPPTRSQGNILINNSSSSNNIYPMDCEPSVISISSSSSSTQPSVQIAPSSLNINQQQQQRYLQHMHNRNSRYIAPTISSSGYVGQKYAPASLPIDLITVAAAAANNNGNGSSSIVVLPSTTTQDHHLNSSTSLIMNHPGSNVYAPFNDGSSIHQNIPKVGSGNTRNHNSNTNNNNSTSNDESMVGVCVQQSPVVIH